MAAASYQLHFLSALGDKLIDDLNDKKRINFDTILDEFDDQRTLKVIKDKLKNGHVWIGPNGSLKWLQRHIPNLYVLDGFFKYGGLAFALRKDWEWADPIRRVFVHYGTTGFFYEIGKKYEFTREKAKDDDDDDKDDQALDLDRFLDMIYLTVAMVLMATCFTIFKYFHSVWFARKPPEDPNSLVTTASAEPGLTFDDYLPNNYSTKL